MRLVLAAEQLFAERGVDAVSLREINRAAGQANASALHYHFGSREALIEAIVALRMPPVNERRLALLRAQQEARGGAPPTPAELAEALVRPLAEAARAPLEENGWLRFLSQVYAGSAVDLHRIARRLRSDASLRLLARRAREALPQVPRALMDQRLAVAVRTTVHALADWQRGVLERQAGARADDLDLFAANLTDMVAAALAAPVSARTLGRLRAVEADAGAAQSAAPPRRAGAR